jgi:hypothetical protein
MSAIARDSRDLEDGRPAPEPESKLAAVPAPTRTFTQVFDDYRELGLSRPAEALWAELNRLWNRKQPIYDPGLEMLTKRMRYSQRSVERALSELCGDRACARCSSDHPMILVQKKGRGHNATIREFSCALAAERIRTGEAVPKSKLRPISEPVLLLDITRQNGGSSIDITRQNGGSSIDITRHPDAPSPDITRQIGGSITTETCLETNTAADGAAAAGSQRTDEGSAVTELIAIGIEAVKASDLVEKFGSAVCREKLAAIERRRRRGRPIENYAGMVIAAIEQEWAVPAVAGVDIRPLANDGPAAGVLDDLRFRIEQGRTPDASWLRDAGISRELFAKIESEVLAQSIASRPIQHLADDLEATNAERYASSMQRIYESLNPPFGASDGGWRHALFFSRCRALLERELGGS